MNQYLFEERLQKPGNCRLSIFRGEDGDPQQMNEDLGAITCKLTRYRQAKYVECLLMFGKEKEMEMLKLIDALHEQEAAMGENALPDAKDAIFFMLDLADGDIVEDGSILTVAPFSWHYTCSELGQPADSILMLLDTQAVVYIDPDLADIEDYEDEGEEMYSVAPENVPQEGDELDAIWNRSFTSGDAAEDEPEEGTVAAYRKSLEEGYDDIPAPLPESEDDYKW